MQGKPQRLFKRDSGLGDSPYVVTPWDDAVALPEGSQEDIVGMTQTAEELADEVRNRDNAGFVQLSKVGPDLTKLGSECRY